MGECGVACAKYLVFVFNLLFALTGIAIITVGAYIQSAYHHYANFVGENFWSAPILLMVVGGVVFVIAFLGCCGAVRESSCMVLTFSVCLIVIFLFEIGIGIAGYSKHDHLREILEKGFNHTLSDYKSNEEAWKLVQSELECCGVQGPKDWQTVNTTIPKSCCASLPVSQSECTLDYAFKDGCMEKLYNILDKKSVILGAVGIGIALIQILGLGYACCLYRAFRRNYETV